MNISYNQDKKIITHPSGVTVEQKVSELNALKSSYIAEKNNIESQIAEIDNDLSEIAALNL